MSAGNGRPVLMSQASGGIMKVTITIEDNANSGDITLLTSFSEGVTGVTNSTAAWLGIKLIARATELSRERKKATAMKPPHPQPLEVSLLMRA